MAEVLASREEWRGTSGRGEGEECEAEIVAIAVSGRTDWLGKSRQNMGSERLQSEEVNGRSGGMRDGRLAYMPVVAVPWQRPLLDCVPEHMTVRLTGSQEREKDGSNCMSVGSDVHRTGLQECASVPGRPPPFVEAVSRMRRTTLRSSCYIVELCAISRQQSHVSGCIHAGQPSREATA